MGALEARACVLAQTHMDTAHLSLYVICKGVGVSAKEGQGTAVGNMLSLGAEDGQRQQENPLAMEDFTSFLSQVRVRSSFLRDR